MNFRGVQSSPAWVRRMLSETFFSFCRRASTSFSDPSTCSRRERCALSVWRATGSDFGDGGAAGFGLLLSRQQRIEEDPCQTADGGGARKASASVCMFMGALL